MLLVGFFNEDCSKEFAKIVAIRLKMAASRTNFYLLNQNLLPKQFVEFMIDEDFLMLKCGIILNVALLILFTML